MKITSSNYLIQPFSFFFFFHLTDRLLHRHWSEDVKLPRQTIPMGQSPEVTILQGTT